MSLTAYQLAEAFPDECQEFIPKVLPVLKSKILDYREQVKRIEAMPLDQGTKSLYMLFVDFTGPIETRKRIEVYEQTMEILKNKSVDKFLSDKHAIATAKARPIDRLHSFEKMKIGTHRVSALCPFHSESSASFVIYRNTNTFNCFAGCGGGDAIAFWMKLHNVSFKKAVEDLSKWSI